MSEGDGMLSGREEADLRHKAGYDRIVYGMLDRGRRDEPQNYAGAAEGALLRAAELADADDWHFWAVHAVVYALRDVADSIRGGGAAGSGTEGAPGAGQ